MFEKYHAAFKDINTGKIFDVGAPFGPKGEIRAYNVHSHLFSVAALPALFTEIVGTNCCYAIIGHAPKEKCAILPGFDYRTIGRLAPTTQRLSTHRSIQVQAKIQNQQMRVPKFEV